MHVLLENFQQRHAADENHNRIITHVVDPSVVQNLKQRNGQAPCHTASFSPILFACLTARIVALLELCAHHRHHQHHPIHKRTGDTRVKDLQQISKDSLKLLEDLQNNLARMHGYLSIKPDEASL